MTRVHNLTRDVALMARGRTARSWWAQLRGLIGSPPLQPGEGLLIVPCPSIHTHFMSFPIDVAYVDRQNRVVGIDAAVKPWRIGRFYRGVRYVVELPAGTLAATGTQVGDELQVAEDGD